MVLVKFYRFGIPVLVAYGRRAAVRHRYCTEAQQSATDWSNPYIVENHWTDAAELAAYLSKRVVAINEHFVIVDKPPGLSVWGHSLAKWEAMKLLRPKYAADAGITLSIKDCLPQLANLLDSTSFTDEVTAHSSVSTFLHLPKGINQSAVHANSNPKLFIVDPIPAAYSGLMLLGRTPEYTSAAQKFYRNAMMGKPPWQLYQQFLAVCLNKPFKLRADNVRFPLATFEVNEYLRIGYRSPDNSPRRSSVNGSPVLQKYVSHRSLVPNTTKSSLVELQLNSTFRGLPELYLLHEGCTVVGELLQSSRLVDTGIAPVVLHPSQAKLNSESPLWLRRLLGHPAFYEIPVHLHRASLYIPTPTFYKSDKINPVHFNSVLPNPVGKIENIGPLSSSFFNLSWTKLTDSEDSSSKSRFVLTCTSPLLPDYFSHTMERLDLHFDYASWRSTKLNSVE